jgi:hypothetical protein
MRSSLLSWFQLFVLLLILPAKAFAQGCVWIASDGTGDFSNIQGGINHVAALIGQGLNPPRKLCVVQGIYTATMDPVVFWNSIDLTIEGGYAFVNGPRDPRAFVTTITGQGVRTVISAGSLSSASILSGVTIREGGGLSSSNAGLRLVGSGLTIQDVRFVQNSPAINAAFTGTFVIERCVFENNAEVGGAAIFAVNAISPIQVRSSKFLGNAAGLGGAIYFSRGSLSVSNSLFVGNSASAIEGISSGDGGAIAATGSNTQVFIHSSTFYGNSAQNLGDALYLSPSVAAASSVQNTISWNSGAGEFYAPGGFPPNVVSYSNVRGGGLIGDGNIDADPEFLSPATMNFRLWPSSPAVDTGTSVSAPSVDGNGSLRPVDGNGDLTANYDMGAFERQSSCAADYDDSGTLTTSDLFDFLADWSAGGGDFNHENGVTTQDLYDYISAWSAGCS